MKSKISVFVLLQYLFLTGCLSFQFKEITNDIFPLDTGIIAAFGHFNSDEYTDIFTLQQGGKVLQIFLYNETNQRFTSSTNCSFGGVITGVVPGDFNGDSIMDILITLSSENNVNNVKIFWGENNTIDCKSKTIFNVTNQPLVVDFNGDMRPDIIGEIESGERFVWTSSKYKNFTRTPIPSDQKFRTPHSSGLGDFNNDLASDILITGENDMELWFNTGNKYVRNGSLLYPKRQSTKFVLPLQSTFVDINLDGIIDHIIPVCYDSYCETSAIYIWNANTTDWQVLHDNFTFQDTLWHFKLPTGSNLEKAALPVTLRHGDIDMDGYPDFITILQSKINSSNVRAVILKNFPCQNCTDCIHERCLKIDWDIIGLKKIPNIQIAAFFDINEDGTLDILASSKINGEWKMHALINTDPSVSCFMKVLVINGLCSHCTSDENRYGVNQPGPFVRYNLTKEDGQPIVSSSIQMSQSAHFPLQLPYSVFGLGQTPNFIDVLTVSIPARFQEHVHKREWIQIIPNSQIVVIPYPINDEKRWIRKLFVTPSHFVVLTCISLVGTCIFISILVAILHWRERKEDKKEKMQDAYRFHFDAM